MHTTTIVIRSLHRPTDRELSTVLAEVYVVGLAQGFRPESVAAVEQTATVTYPDDKNPPA